MKFLVAAAFMMTGALATQVTAAVIVRDGRPMAVIVVQNDAPQADKAASHIQHYVGKMSGAELAIVVEGNPIPDGMTTRLLVGRTAAAMALGVEIPAGYDSTPRLDAFDDEGYVLKTIGSDLVIAGNEDGPYLGTFYAACRLLNELGVRWYFPGDWGEIVPKTQNVPMPQLNLRTKPDFPVRNIWLSGWVPVSPEEKATYRTWGERIGFNRDAGFGTYPLVGDGYLASLVHPNEFYEKEPELYAMNQAGKRELHQRGNMGYYDRHTMLCLSNPRVFELSVKHLTEAFAGERKMNTVTANGVGISPPDGAPFCYCENCLAMSQNFNYPKYVHERMQSEEFFGFAARLAGALPDKWVSTMAYALREMPPEGVALPKNVHVRIAPISCCVLHHNLDPACWRRQEYVNILAHWLELTPHVTIYDYNPGMLTGMWLPERDVANMTVNAKVYRDLGVKGMAREGRKAFMQTWISYYVTAKLLWDADADVDAIKQDFYTTFFGPDAGPHVQAWWDACEAQLATSNTHVHEDFMINHLYDVAFVESIGKHVEAADKAKMTDAQRARFDAFTLIADHLDAYARMHEAEKNLRYAEAAVHAGRMYADQAQLAEIDSFLMTHRPGAPRRYFVEGRKVDFEKHAAQTDGTTGTLVAEIPVEAPFRRDPYNRGLIARWYLPDHGDSDWQSTSTYLLWDQSWQPENERGNDYDGYGWYHMKVTVPSPFVGKPVRLWLGGAINEAWVWVNGHYAGRKEHKIWWAHWHDFELDVTDMVKPGEENVIAVRVFNDAEVGGLHRRGYLWSPNP